MTNILKDIIKAFNNTDTNLEIFNKGFADEIIFDQDLSGLIYWDIKFLRINFEKVNFSGSYFTNCKFENCKFENCKFEKTFMRKSEFTDCTFKNCNLIDSSFSKVEFDNNLFRNCQFYNINLGWSCWLDCILKKTKFEQVDFEGATLSNLKIKFK